MDIQPTGTDLTKFGELAIMDFTGDTKIIWSRDNEDEIENAKRTFTDLRGKGYAVFKVDKKGEKAEQVHEFDRNVERLIFVPPMVGG